MTLKNISNISARALIAFVFAPLLFFVNTEAAFAVSLSEIGKVEVTEADITPSDIKLAKQDPDVLDLKAEAGVLKQKAEEAKTAEDAAFSEKQIAEAAKYSCENGIFSILQSCDEENAVFDAAKAKYVATVAATVAAEQALDAKNAEIAAKITEIALASAKSRKEGEQIKKDADEIAQEKEAATGATAVSDAVGAGATSLSDEARQEASEVAVGPLHPADISPESPPIDQELVAQLKKDCEITSGSGIMACAALIPYYFIYKPISWAMILSGMIFDAAITLSLDKKFINQPFVEEMWKILLDFSNMLFIFILLYTGISTIFGLGNWKESVKMVIIVALFINFSLFFTKVVIDAGNILAVGVYSAIGAEKAPRADTGGSSGTLLSSTQTNVKERDIAESLTRSFAPEKFLEKASKVGVLDAAVVFIIASIVSLALAYIFLEAAFLFIGRMLAFWFLMIISPIAFISFILPKMKAPVFDKWFDTLISQTFMAPAFLFFVYLIIKLLEGTKDAFVFL